MILNTKCRYAVMAVIELAEDKSHQPVSLTTISQKQEISLAYLEQIFSRLRKAGIVASVKGPGGGYVLAKDRHKITVAEIIQAVGEPMKMTRCSSGQKSCLTSNSKCKTHRLWHGLENKIHEYFNSISLSDI
jgi:Rrf2 family iron-sulfur cluster assembly transcriptional regulator